MSINFLTCLKQQIPSVHIANPHNSQHDVGEYNTPHPLGIIEPSTIEQVIRIIKLANASSEAIKLQPFSIGKNWGLGSKKSATVDAIYLDLHRLDDIREISLNDGYAIIEPGVTQGRLSQELVNTRRQLNVTASSAQTSILGNALDRGVGLNQQRTADLLGIEIILADGSIQRIGCWPENGKSIALYPHGIGPSLLQLFCQSSYAVVTAGLIRLSPRREKIRVAHISFTPKHLFSSIEIFRQWYEQGLIRDVLKIYDATSSITYGSSKGEFLAHIPISGSSALVDAVSKIIEQEFFCAKGFITCSWNDSPDDHYSDDIVAKVVSSCYCGDLSYNDDLLLKTLGTSADLVDDSGNGWIFFLPLIPFSGTAITKAYRHIKYVSKITGIRCGATINALNDHIIDLVVSIRFNRKTEEASRAHQALRLLHERFGVTGFYPYRLDVSNTTNEKSRITELAKGLKTHFDPKGVFADGRYI